MKDERVTPTSVVIQNLLDKAKCIVETAEGMVNYLEGDGLEEIDYSHLLFWSDLKTINSFAEPIVSILAGIADRDDFADDLLPPKEGECPGCGSGSITYGSYEDESGALQRECVCGNCGKKFRQFFVFDGVDEPAE